MLRVAIRSFAALVSFTFLMAPVALSAQGWSWLDGNLASWNAPGRAIPTAPYLGAPDPRCAARERPAETIEDNSLLSAGWRLFLPYQRGWNVTLAAGLAGYDGMCRPMSYQHFVFVDGIFAGTIAPAPMDSRFDGAAGTVSLWYADLLTAEFRRYTPNDPLCCPSSSTHVEYTILNTPAGPVLNPVSAT
jgi:hypothetical protein